MKVIMVTAGMSGGGTERVIAVLANYMVEKSHEVKIVMTSRNEVAYELQNGVQVISIGGSTGGSLSKRLKRIRDLRRLFKQDKEQVIVSFGTETNLFSLLAGAGLKNKTIVSERNDPNRCTYPVLRNIVYRMADSLIFQTEDARRCFPKGIAKKGTVIANPLSGEIKKSDHGVRSREIVTAGRLEPQKNHRLLIEAFQGFTEQFPEYRLVIYGKGCLEEELKAFVKELHLEEKVLFAGFTGHIQEKLCAAAMFVLSSDYEGVSNSLMEAMALGIPVISTDCPIGGSAMLIKDKENGLLVPVGNAKALTEAMKYMAEDRERAEDMGRRAEYVHEEYAAGKICEEWICVIAEGHLHG